MTDGIAALNDAMNQLLDGASQLKAGAAQLAAGSLALLDGANRLDSGLGQLTEGLDTLTSNNAALTSGAQQVADGVLDSASQTLMENGLIDTPMTWDTYEAVMDDILSLGDKTLAAGRRRWCAPSGSRLPSSRPAAGHRALPRGHQDRPRP